MSKLYFKEFLGISKKLYFLGISIISLKLYFKELGFCSPLKLKKSGPVFICRGDYVTQITFYNFWTNHKVRSYF